MSKLHVIFAFTMAGDASDSRLTNDINSLIV